MSERDSIYVLENVISDKLLKECIRLVDLYGVLETSIHPQTNTTGYVVCKTNGGSEYTEISQQLRSQVFENMTDLIQRRLRIYIYGSSGYQLRKLTGPTSIHCDGVLTGNEKTILDKKSLRVLSIIIALNDYEGGEIVFPKQNITVKLKKNQAIIFPPFWTHPHYVNAPINNTVRYTINTWFYGE